MKLGCRYAVILIPILFAASRDARAQFGDWKFDGFPAPSPAISTTGTPGGWYGGDSGYMIPLDANTMFWTFADVYIGAQPVAGARNRSGACTGISVGNSIALVKRDPETKAVTTTHYFRGSPVPDASGVFSQGPYPFFAAPNVSPKDRNKNNGDRLWPHKSFLLGGSLYIFTYLLNTENDHYTIKQTVIVKVVNPFDSPSKWEFGYLYIGKNTGQQVAAYYGAEAFYVESPDPNQNYLYVYGIYCSDYNQFFQKFQVLGLRVPLDKLKAATDGTDLEPVTQVMARKYGTWKPLPVDPEDFYEIGNSRNLGYQSISTRFNRTLNSWQVTFSYDKDVEDGKFGSVDPKSRTVWVAKGAGPFGPWEKPMLAFTFPEAAIPTPTPGIPATPPGQLPPDPATVRGGPPGGIFAGKLYSYFALEVPELESSDDVLAITYATDTTRVDIDRYWNLGVYTIKLVKPVPNPLMRR
jgi:hypothetical protein